MRVLLQRNRWIGVFCWAAAVQGAGQTMPARQDLEGLIEAALDQKITKPIEITDRPIPAALKELGGPTGLEFVIDPAALEWMPYGRETRLTIHLDQVSVRQGLRRIFGGLGLTLFVQEDKVRVEPAPWLERLGRRLTLEEVSTLKKLAERRWPELKASGGVAITKMPREVGTAATLAQELARHPGANGLAQLEAVTQQLGCLWIPDGGGVAVYSFSEDVEQRLDRPFDVHYSRMPLDRMLLDIGRRCGITIHFEAGLLSKLRAGEQKVDLIQREITARQILELLVGRFNALWYETVDDGIAMGWGRPDSPPTPAAREPTTPRVVAILRLPVDDGGTTFDVLIWEDQVPAEYQDVLEKLRQCKVPEVFKLLREKLADPVSVRDSAAPR